MVLSVVYHGLVFCVHSSLFGCKSSCLPCVTSFGISWVISSSVVNYLLAWEGFFVRKVKKKVMVFPYVIFWSIWTGRNLSL